MLLALLACSCYAPSVNWKTQSATYTKEVMHRCVGYHPYSLQGNCKYAVGYVGHNPVILLPYRQTTAIGEPIVAVWLYLTCLIQVKLCFIFLSLKINVDIAKKIVPNLSCGGRFG